MPLFYPSFSALALAQRDIFRHVGAQTPGYRDRIGAAWYWQLPAGILVRAILDYSVTEERWDTIRAEASTPRAGAVSAADFPFAAYAASLSSPPFIHDLSGQAEWANRLYFSLGDMIADCVQWIGMLHTVAISPQISPPAAFPVLNTLERKLVRYALDELGGEFRVGALQAAFHGQISAGRLGALARAWEASQLLTERPRRVTYALEVLAGQDHQETQEIGDTQ